MSSFPAPGSLTREQGVQGGTLPRLKRDRAGCVTPDAPVFAVSSVWCDGTRVADARRSTCSSVLAKLETLSQSVSQIQLRIYCVQLACSRNASPTRISLSRYYTRLVRASKQPVSECRCCCNVIASSSLRKQVNSARVRASWVFGTHRASSSSPHLAKAEIISGSCIGARNSLNCCWIELCE